MIRKDPTLAVGPGETYTRAYIKEGASSKLVLCQVLSDGGKIWNSPSM